MFFLPTPAMPAETNIRHTFYIGAQGINSPWGWEDLYTKTLSRTVRQGRTGKTFPEFLAAGDYGKKQKKFRE
jgi:hypothetical protein